MPEHKKEILFLNLLLSLLALGTIGFAVWTVASDQFKAGTDDLFILMVCLLLALLFAAAPLSWAHSNGLLKIPAKKPRSADKSTAGEAKAAAK